MFDLSLYSLVLLAHVTTATVLIGHALLAPLIRRATLSADSLASLRTWLDFGERAAKANPVAAMILLTSGVYLGSVGWWTQPWFYVAAAAWLANSLLATLVIRKTAMRIGRAAGLRDGAIDPDVDRLRQSPGWHAAETILASNDLAMIYVMFLKPGLLECCIVIIGCAAVGFAWSHRPVRGRVEQREAVMG